jgi:hypothetical protein
MFHSFLSLIHMPSLHTCSEGASSPHPPITAWSLPVYSQVIPKNSTGGEGRPTSSPVTLLVLPQSNEPVSAEIQYGSIRGISDRTRSPECFVPCTEMKELELTSRRYTERRRITATPKCERRSVHSGRQLRAGHARTAYLVQAHRQSCVVCQCEQVAVAGSATVLPAPSGSFSKLVLTLA